MSQGAAVVDVEASEGRRTAGRRSWRDRPGTVVLGCVVAYLPFTLLGYGTDIDVANVLRAGRTWLEDGRFWYRTTTPGKGGRTSALPASAWAGNRA